MGKAKTGFRLGSYRSGDRSEYLAALALSRVAFVTSIPRQEDIGVFDYLCVLSRNEGKHVYPESAFYVQVKSNKKALEPKDVAFDWINEHMEHPLFICVVNKNKSEVSFYSCMYLWRALFGHWTEKRSLRIKYDGIPGEEKNEQHKGKLRYTINLGHPILQKTIQEIETTPDEVYEILHKWITLDAVNIVRRRVGRAIVTDFDSWKTNESPCETKTRLYYSGDGPALIEKELAPILVALACNYKKANMEEKDSALRAFLDKIGIKTED